MPGTPMGPAAEPKPLAPPELLACTSAEAPGPRRVWRLTSLQYSATVAAFVNGRPATPVRPGGIGIPAPLDERDADETFSNLARFSSSYGNDNGSFHHDMDKTSCAA
jgi:hypothetical protein